MRFLPVLFAAAALFLSLPSSVHCEDDFNGAAEINDAFVDQNVESPPVVAGNESPDQADTYAALEADMADSEFATKDKKNTNVFGEDAALTNGAQVSSEVDSEEAEEAEEEAEVDDATDVYEQNGEAEVDDAEEESSEQADLDSAVASSGRYSRLQRYLSGAHKQPKIRVKVNVKI